MRNKSVAVIDIRSSEITAAVAGRGVNNTFIIKSKFSRQYEGYAEGQLLDEKSFYDAVSDVAGGIISASGDKIRKIFIGVPGEFLTVINTENVISFQSIKKVTFSDVKALEDMSRPQSGDASTIIHSDCIYYVLSDLRRVVNPVGMMTDSLRGRLCFYLCNNNFCNMVIKCLERFSGIKEIVFLPSVHAQAMYLIPPERRDEYAVLFDLGFISSDYSVICGNGLVYNQAFSLGAGHIALYLTEALDMPYDVALNMLSKVNLNSKEGSDIKLECAGGGKLYSFSSSEIKEKVREALDGVCETIEECIRNFTERNTEFKPIYLTGECAESIRGASEHISGRLVRTISVISPQLPYYDKPRFSSLFSLFDMALEKSGRHNFLKQ